jgi:PHS family inorganic phosphate transporter-like MFS transporter
MLATVFYMQPIGQLVANIVAIIATALSHRYIYHDADPSKCVGDCMETTDKIWRWIVGLGAVLPALALLARIFIPESPRYLLEVEKDSHTAQENANMYFTDPFEDPDQDDVSGHFEAGEPGGADGGEFAIEGRLMPMLGLSERQLQVLEDEPSVMVGSAHADRPPTENPDAIAYCPPVPHYSTSSRNSGNGEATPNGGYTASPSPGPPLDKTNVVIDINSALPSINITGQDDKNEEQFQLPPPQEPIDPTGNDNGASGAAENPQESTKTRKASWKEFWKGFRVFLFEPESLEVAETEELVIPPQLHGHRVSNGSEAPKRWTDGNWTDLAGTSATWFLLDFSFYFLGVNSWKIIAQIWDTPEYTSVYQLIMQFSWRALVSVSVSSIIGGALFIAMARYRHNLQTYGFLILAAFLIAVGATSVTLLGGKYFAAIIVLYFFTQLFFDFGKYCLVPGLMRRG